MKIKKIKAREVLNSRNKKTIEVEINGYKASVPSGTSKGKYEVESFPNGSVKKAIEILNKAKLKGFKFEIFSDLEELEEKLEGSGGNTVIATEYALLKAASKNNIWKFLNPEASKMPMPLGNIIGGGSHYNGKSQRFQEFLLLPEAKTFKDAAFINEYIYRNIKKEIIKLDKNFKGQKTFEGAWAPDLKITEILELLNSFIKKVEEKFYIHIKLGIDVAASEFFNKTYNYNGVKLTKDEQIKFISKLIKKFNLSYIEDPLNEDDFDGFSKLNELNKNTLICGDDLICTNIERLKKAKINSVIVKPNQIGSLIKTKEIIDYAKSNNIIPILSHRSGETLDITISHLAFAFQVPIFKCGIYGKERAVKIKELIKIENSLF